MTGKKHRNCMASSRKILVLALLAAFGQAQAADEKVEALINPNMGDVSVGVGVASGSPNDRALFGQYNGLKNNQVNALLDFLYVNRTADGVWTRAQGVNLGLDIPEVTLAYGKQGDWGAWLDYNQIVRQDPYTVNTGVGALGTTNPIIGNSLVAPGAGGSQNLSTTRKGLTVGVGKWLLPNLSFDVNYKTEDKTGSRVSGVGGYCSNIISPVCYGAVGTVAAMYLTPEPINSNSQQLDAKLTYSGDGYALTAGYYGTFYSNYNSLLTPTFPNGGATLINTGGQLGLTAGLLSQPVALAPDNQANQIYLSGFTALPMNTKVNFKASYNHATQSEAYPWQTLVGAAPGVNGNLNGAVDTSLIQVGLTSRPVAQFYINANARYEDRQDKTQLGNYVIAPNNSLWTNWPNSSKYGTAKLEGGYQMTDVDRALLGVDYTNINRIRAIGSTYIPPTSVAAMRENNNETGVYAEYRRSMAETVNAALTYRHANRYGYHWYAIDAAAGYPYIRWDQVSNLPGVFPYIMLDRTRDTLKLTGDWQATNNLSFNIQLEGGKDSYNGPTAAGMQDTGYQLYNIDAAMKFSENWRGTAYISWGKQTLNMQQWAGYIAALDQVNSALGLGVVGTLKGGWEVGGDLTYQQDKNHYNLGMTTQAPVSNLPDTKYQATFLKLYGKVALDKKSDLRFDFVQQWAQYNDWQWGYNGVPFTYSDNTTLSMQPTQNVSFFGARYIYNFK